MRKPSRTIVGFAVLGLAIAGALYVYALTYDYTKPQTPRDAAVGVASFIFCPPTLLFVMCIDCETTGWDGVIVFSIVGILNALLYGAVGAAFERILRKRQLDRQASSRLD